ncbi:MAG: creatininase family protein [Rhodospirillaceae bacterium]
MPLWSTLFENPLSQITADPARAVAVLPCGALETHGPHLPLGTDLVLAERLADLLVTDMEQDQSTGVGPVLRLPALWLGASAEHGAGLGTLSQPEESLIAALSGLWRGLVQSGVRKVLMLNAHGGNVPSLAIAALRARAEYGLLAAAVHWLDFGLPDDLVPPSPAREDVHGGWLEMSLMLALAPEQVGSEPPEAAPVTALAKTGVAALYPMGPAGWGWMTGDLSGKSWAGRPDLGSAALGAKIAAHAVAGFRRTLEDLSSADWPVA